jgi:hypothetical protein
MMAYSFIEESRHNEPNQPNQDEIKQEIDQKTRGTNPSIWNIDKRDLPPTAGRRPASLIITNEKYREASAQHSSTRSVLRIDIICGERQCADCQENNYHGCETTLSPLAEELILCHEKRPFKITENYTWTSWRPANRILLQTIEGQ